MFNKNTKRERNIDLEVDGEEFAEGDGGEDTHTGGQGQHQPNQLTVFFSTSLVHSSC